MDNAQPEPSMEEILASIRRIISEDEDEQPKSEAQPAAAPATASAPKPALASVPPASEKPAEASTPKPQEAASPSEEPAPAPISASAQSSSAQNETSNKQMAATMQNEIEDDILDQTTAAAASKAFTTLSQSVRVSEGPGKTLEDIVTEMLRPMVKEWLDSNLPAIVEEKVEEEVQRVARRRRG